MADDRETQAIVAKPDVPALEVASAPAVLGAGDVIDAEGVRYRPLPRPKRWLRWLLLLFQIVVAIGVAWFFYQIPLGAFPGPIQNWKNPLVIFVLICFIGKTLLDTLFYDHYQP